MYDPGVLYNVVIVISLDDLFGILFSIDQYVLFASQNSNSNWLKKTRELGSIRA